MFLPTTAIALTFLSATIERRPLPWPLPLRPTAFTLYLAIAGSVVAFASYFHLVRRVRLRTLTTLVLVEPILALAIDALFERRVRLAPSSYLGALLTLSGVLTTVLVGRGDPAPSGSRPRSPPVDDR